MTEQDTTFVHKNVDMLVFLAGFFVFLLLSVPLWFMVGDFVGMGVTLFLSAFILYRLLTNHFTVTFYDEGGSLRVEYKTLKGSVLTTQLAPETGAIKRVLGKKGKEGLYFVGNDERVQELVLRTNQKLERWLGARGWTVTQMDGGAFLAAQVKSDLPMERRLFGI